MAESASQQKSIGCGTIIVLLFGFAMLNSMCNNDSGTSGTGGASADRKIAAWVMAQQFVKQRLKSPGSASFGSLFGDDQDPNHVVSDLGGGQFRVRAWVEAQNSFGATIRTPFVCELEDGDVPLIVRTGVDLLESYATTIQG